MTSRALPTPAPALAPATISIASSVPQASWIHHEMTTRIFPPVAAAFSLFLTFSVCFCKITRRKRPSSSPSSEFSSSLHEFSYSALRRATGSFSPANRLGQGGFGSVFRGRFGSSSASKVRNVAVKVMDSGSLQGEREFLNELFFAAKLHSPYVVPVLGFSHNRKQRRMILVYELMDNGNLQDALLHRKCPELMEWNRRFLVAVDIAKGIEYLHSLNPPVIHGDIKPSNILLDQFFSAKLADFGLAREKSDQVEVAVESSGGGGTEGYGSVVEELESVITNTTGYEESNLGFTDQSPGTANVPFSSPETIHAPLTSPETATTVTIASVSPEMADKLSILDGVESEKDVGCAVTKRNGKDWWRKQEGNVGKGKDYVMQWIGSEVKKERPISDWITDNATPSLPSEKLEKKKSIKRLDWWLSLDEEKEKKKMKKRRMLREWWKDEYRKELAKNKKNRNLESEFYSVDSEGSKNRKKRRDSSNNSRSSSIDWWLDGRKNSHDSVSSEIAKSCGISSTPSMRGTVCYAAPECGSIDDVSEKCDVYSYGVVLLVMISGRRPLEMTGSASEFQRANLMSWARKLARRGRIGDLVDQKLQNLDQEQAVLCIKVALQCLQRSPVSRPKMKEVVGMLTGAINTPELPTEFSPILPFKTRRKQRG